MTSVVHPGQRSTVFATVKLLPIAATNRLRTLLIALTATYDNYLFYVCQPAVEQRGGLSSNSPTRTKRLMPSGMLQAVLYFMYDITMF